MSAHGKFIQVRSGGLRPCPVAGCPARIPAHLAMCGSHWHLVPAPFKQAVLREFREHRGQGSHIAAIDAACRAVESLGRTEARS